MLLALQTKTQYHVQIVYSTVVNNEKMSLSSIIITKAQSSIESLAAKEFRVCVSFDIITISSKGNFHAQRDKYSKKWS